MSCDAPKTSCFADNEAIARMVLADPDRFSVGLVEWAHTWRRWYPTRPETEQPRKLEAVNTP